MSRRSNWANAEKIRDSRSERFARLLINFVRSLVGRFLHGLATSSEVKAQAVEPFVIGKHTEADWARSNGNYSLAVAGGSRGAVPLRKQTYRKFGSPSGSVPAVC